MKKHSIHAIVLFMFFPFLVTAQSKKIEFNTDKAYPEGIVYDGGADVFYVSSVRTGTIARVSRDGKYTEVYKDSNLKSSFGMKILPSAKKLWVCIADPNFSQYRDSSTYKKMSRLISLDLSSGQKVADINLAGLYNGKHFANDLTIDDKGNIYVTDSYSPAIYKVTPDGKAELFVSHEQFASIATGLNGIAFHSKGYLLVANNGNGSLLKVDLKNPSSVTRVKINQFFPGADGLLFDAKSELILVQNGGVNKIFRLSSNDDWNTATVIASTKAEDMFNFPSTATLQGNNVWVMNAKLGELKDSTKILSDKFVIQQAVFTPIKK